MKANLDPVFAIEKPGEFMRHNEKFACVHV